MEVSFEGDEVRAVTTRGDTGHPIGYFRARIVSGNIAVRNGVVHLIDGLLSVKKRRAVFPYVSVWQKVSSDPFLNISNYFAEGSGLNDLFREGSKGDRFTYFVPVNHAWKDFGKGRKLEKFFGRHLVISKTAYTMEALEIYSKVLENSSVRLYSFYDVLEMEILKTNEEYQILWKNRTIRVLAPDIECTDGIVHEIEGLFLSEP